MSSMKVGDWWSVDCLVCAETVGFVHDDFVKKPMPNIFPNLCVICKDCMKKKERGDFVRGL